MGVRFPLPAPGPLRYLLSDFDFDLPPDLIAQVPAAERTASRLLHVDGMRRTDLAFTDLPSLLSPGDLVVFNDTRVLHARVFARKSTGGSVELMLERVVADDEAWAQVRASHAPKPGAVCASRGRARAWSRATAASTASRSPAPGPLPAWLERHGEVPLPPYIAPAADGSDEARYQTVYARARRRRRADRRAALRRRAARALAARGVERAFVTLHVGAGTFHPVQHDDLARHRMHAEWYSLPPATVEAVTRRAGARRAGRRRRDHDASRARVGGARRRRDRAGAREPSLFVTPGYRFGVVDRLVTNFHLPRSTLLMLVSAFAGFDAIRAAYAHAIAARYRFYSYGDALLLERGAAA